MAKAKQVKQVKQVKQDEYTLLKEELKKPLKDQSVPVTTDCR